MVSKFLSKLLRKKYVSFDSSPLPRVLSLLDLTALGIGSTVGVGFYVLAGDVSRNIAGPAVIISFLIAGIASLFSGLCYAEFGARVPKAGSAYVYSYVCVGEFVAFIIGWNLILEYVIGTASVARGFSGYLDDLLGNAMSSAFNRTMHINLPSLSPYPDFFAFSVIILLCVVLCIGVKESTRMNNVFTGLNIFVILYVIIAGATQVDFENWTLSSDEVHNSSVCSEPKEATNTEEDPWGKGGFAPYGLSGIMKGAATCFFGFVGFDVIATTGEEAKKPERNIPVSIAISLACVFCAYFFMSAVLTLAIPYCMQDPNAPLIELFDVKGMSVSKWIVSIGALFGFLASLIGAMFPMPRIIYSMADDGLLFRFLSRLSVRFKTPITATLISGFGAGVMALLFSLTELVDMMSIGTLMAYTMVSLCVMLLRHSHSSGYLPIECVPLTFANDNEREKKSIAKSDYSFDKYMKGPSQFSFSDYLKQMANLDRLQEPSPLSSSLVNYMTIVFFVCCFCSDIILVAFFDKLMEADAATVVFATVFFSLTILCLGIIALQPTSSRSLSFKVPFVPWTPAVSVFINLYLMCNLSHATWIRFLVWMVAGLAIYFFYGISNSSSGIRLEGDVPPSLNHRVVVNLANVGSIFDSESEDEY